MSSFAVKAQSVSKKFCKSLRKSMYYGAVEVLSNTFGLAPDPSTLRKEEFWAVKDVSFELAPGETLGLIGPNGSGKTTLLRMLNGIFMPDQGKIEMRGRVGALIQVGAGFHPMLTGRENIYINGAILGMGRREIDRKFDSIVDFADIGEFLDSPVKYYSSGMYVRLGFAIAVHCEPDILLIDEILAVGDLAFRVKCYNKIEELTKNCAVIIVSHNMSSIARIASKCIVLNESRVFFQGPAEQAIQQYYTLAESERANMSQLAGTQEANVENLKIFNHRGEERDIFRYGEPLAINFDIEISPEYPKVLASFMFFNQRMELVAQSDSKYNSVTLFNDGRKKTIQVTFPQVLLNPGHYTINLTVFDETHQRYLYWNHNTKPFKVEGDFIGNASVQLLSEWTIR